ncbi:MAG: 6-phosphogluconolactonase [Methylococcales bacterium]|nr:6-phosphogluconolactonase [Methylococcales bacterium]
MQALRWHIQDDAEAVARAALTYMINAATRAIAERGVFHLVLAGGSTPKRVYQLLAQAKPDTRHWHVYMGDERCLPADDPERNSKMAFNAWLAKDSMPREQIFMMPAELGPEQGAAAYQQTIANVGQFDMVLLGMGEDGHTASLFPGHHHDLEETVHAVYHSPKPPPERISLSAKRLSQACQVVFLVAGHGKQEAVQQWREGVDLPVANITPEAGVDVLIDRTAMGE